MVDQHPHEKVCRQVLASVEEEVVVVMGQDAVGALVEMVSDCCHLAFLHLLWNIERMIWYFLVYLVIKLLYELFIFYIFWRIGG